MRKFSLLFLSLLLVLTTALAQQRTISGVVLLAPDNEPAFGATVQVKEQPRVGTTVGSDGKFRLTLPPGGKTLLISYISYKPIEVLAKENLRLILSADEQTLKGVVVTGMTKIDKRLFTGAATKIGGDKSKLDGVPDAARALEGKAAGVSVQNVSGTFGSAPKIRIRGATSIFGASKPLWVVDGVVLDDPVEVDADALASGDATTLIGSAIAGLNPDDIESFQVLKDGSATSIYGARAMAGVIVVTTKKGRSGVSRFTYTGEYTYRLKPSYRNFNIMNSQEQMSFYRELEQKGWLQLANLSNARNYGVYGKMWDLVNRGELLNTEASRNAYLREAEYRNTDWFDLLFQNTILNTHSVSITSGSDKVSYYASMSAMVDPGWTLQSKVNRYTMNLNTTYKLTKRLSLNLIGSGSIRQQTAPGTLDSDTDATTGRVSRSFDINPYSYALNTSRTLDPNVFYRRSYTDFNIFHELDNNYLKIGVTDLRFQGELKYRPITGLEIGLLGDIKYSGSTTKHHITEKSNYANAYRAMQTEPIRDNNIYLYKDPDKPYARPETVLPVGGFRKTNEYSLLAWDTRLSASYNKEIGDHLMNFYGGAEINSSDRTSEAAELVGIIYGLGNKQTFDPQYFKQLKDAGEVFAYLRTSYYRNMAFFGNATYSYLGKYTVNGTLRYEGTNKMGRSRSARWLPTWNVSGAWHADKEKFFAPLHNTISSLTLKASYSLTADKGPNSVSNSRVIVAPSTPWRFPAYLQEDGYGIQRAENSELTYEKKHELNLGFDASLLKERINLSFDWYRRNNFDLIGPTNTQGLSGALLLYGNVASMRSSGVEFSISTTNIKTKDFRWTTDFVYAHTNNRITSLKNNSPVYQLVAGRGLAREGYPVRSLFSIPFRGLNEYGLPTLTNEHGVRTVEDINLQERKKVDFLTYSGSIDPTDFGSLGNTFSYKRLKLNVFLTYSFGNVVRLPGAFDSYYTDLQATPREFNDRYIHAGDEQHTHVPVIASYRTNYETDKLNVGYGAYNFTDIRVAKGDFIRLKEISLSYDLPKSFVRKLSVADASIKVQASNLLLLYSDKKLRGQDPEFFNAGGVATPLPKQFTVTLRVGI